MQEIVGSVQKVGTLVAEIASASQEQSQGIAQGTTAVTQMDQVVQQNAALVEEASAATESMKEQSAALLRGNVTRRPPARAGTAPPRPRARAPRSLKRPGRRSCAPP